VLIVGAIEDEWLGIYDGEELGRLVGE